MMERIAEASPRFKARIAGALFLLGSLSAVFGEFFVRRLEIAADLIAVSSMIAVTLLLYGVFKPVLRGLSLLAASFNLVGLTFGALRWNPRGVDIPVVFDGFYCLLIGYLIFKSTFLPRILGALIACAGFGWLTFLSPPLARYLSPYNLALGILGQGSVMLWLLMMGVNEQRWKEQASPAVEGRTTRSDLPPGCIEWSGQLPGGRLPGSNPDCDMGIGTDKFECIGRRRSARCTKAELSDQADSETPRRLPHAEYVFHRTGCAQEDDQLLREGWQWHGSRRRHDRCHAF